MTIGCRKPEMQRCVDQQNAVVADDLCHDDGATESSAHRYYYGGTGDDVVGSLVAGGSFAPVPGHSYSTARGGFGSTFSGEEMFLMAGLVGIVVAVGG